LIKENPFLIPVILSGGTGSRLWPLSREGHPKPFIKLFDGETLLQKTYRRVSLIPDTPKVNGKPFALTVTNREYYFISKDELDKTDVSSVYLLEPESKNTAPAISMAALWIKKNYGENASMLIVPADHLIQNESEFLESVKNALELNYQVPPYLVTFGIKPESADTGFGYIESGKALSKGFEVSHFHEKPDVKTAQNFITSNNFYWNSGIFCFNVKQFFDEMKIHAPEVLAHVERSWQECFEKDLPDHSIINIPEATFKHCPNISIDFALMEKSKNVAVIPANLHWSDIGSWLSFSQLFEPDLQGNSIVGNALVVNSRDTFIQANDRVVAAVGVENLIIIDTPDALLVIDKSHTQDVKLITSRLKQNQKEILHSHRTIMRPWGSFTTLQSGHSYKIKCIEVKPLKSLSLQSHRYRSEHWVVIEGEAEVTNQEKLYRVKTNESTFINQGAKHRLHNPLPNTTLKIIEVQSGKYLGEDDIERFEDQFGRI
jgi:mannose-1-phosphate guanylyltransferase/mannose-6-phosphate isomerase